MFSLDLPWSTSALLSSLNRETIAEGVEEDDDDDEEEEEEGVSVERTAFNPFGLINNFLQNEEGVFRLSRFLDDALHHFLLKLTKQRRLVSGLTASPSSTTPSLESNMIAPTTVFAFPEEEEKEEEEREDEDEGVLDLQLLLLLPPPRPTLFLSRALSGDSSLRSREYCLFVSRVSLPDERRLCDGRMPLSSRTASGHEPVGPPALAALPFSSKLVPSMRLESSVTGVLLCERSWSTSAVLGCSVWSSGIGERKDDIASAWLGRTGQRSCSISYSAFNSKKQQSAHVRQKYLHFMKNLFRKVREF
ncbi:hypothetical protein EYF80_018621 [Liparis tanakae]|uniref:Uncharacterized protein n=1 Tax=Liparis tanakae TaxID=230148 RepID=A0A4Z2HZV6_9TELE|nr:hypothetical protein EYF80_018621 [Liparis tanakae]